MSSHRIKYLGMGEMKVSSWGFEVKCGCGNLFQAFFPMIMASSGIATCDKCHAAYSINQVTLNDALKDPRNNDPQLVLVNKPVG